MDATWPFFKDFKFLININTAKIIKHPIDSYKKVDYIDLFNIIECISKA